jgi:hypothetical protein
MVKIELQSRIQLASITNGSSWSKVQIGEKLFRASSEKSPENICYVYALMSVQEFERLKDNSLITVNNVRLSDDLLKELYKNGEPKEVYGAKFGRLDKKMIDKFPVIEINAP